MLDCRLKNRHALADNKVMEINISQIDESDGLRNSIHISNGTPGSVFLSGMTSFASTGENCCAKAGAARTAIRASVESVCFTVFLRAVSWIPWIENTSNR